MFGQITLPALTPTSFADIVFALTWAHKTRIQLSKLGMQTILSDLQVNLLSSPSSTSSMHQNNATNLHPPSRRTHQQLELYDDSDDVDLPWNRSISTLTNKQFPMAKGPFSDTPITMSPKTSSHQQIQPSTPISRKEYRAGSGSGVRSILRGPNTPGTGQSVRFFSKDAYKLISPNASPSRSTNNSNQSNNNNSNSPLFTQQIQELTANSHSSNSHSRSHSSSMLLPDSRNNISDTNLFNMSLDMPPIPLPEEGSHMLSDDAIEVPEFEDRGEVASSKFDDSHGSLHLKLEDSTPSQPRNGAFPSPAEPATVYSTPAATTAAAGNTTSYWSARSWLPPLSLFNNTPVTPSTLLSAQESLIASLRDELALQKSITTQYAADLDSRDEFIDILCARVEVAETELEEVCLVEEEQFELIRSFRKQLGCLERAVGRIKVDESISRQDVQSLRSNRSADANANADESQLQLLTEERDELLEEVARLQRARNDDQEGWNEEKYDLLTKLGEAEAADSSNAKPQPRGNLTENDRDQIRLLQEELEAQWERTEKASEELRVLRKENAELKASVTALQEKNGEGEGFEELESTNQELVNQLNDVLAAQQALEEERDQISEELRSSRQHVEDLMQSHSDLQRKLEAAEQEHAFVLENSDRLQTALQQRDNEIATLEDARQSYHTELETLRSRLSSLDKEHARTLSERTRHIEELEEQLAVHTERSTQLMNNTAERDIYLASLEEKAERRGEECERMRRRMHELESESAAREVKLVELERDSERVREDNMNLNIALDSKQQELELIKRKLGVKGTGGATPAPSRTTKAPRESSIFGGATPRLLTGLNRTVIETPGTDMKTPRAKQSLSSSTTMRARNDTAKLGPPTIMRPPRQSMGSPLAYTRPLSRTEGNTRTTSTGAATTHLARSRSRSSRRASTSSVLNMDEYEFEFRDEEEKENQALQHQTNHQQYHYGSTGSSNSNNNNNVNQRRSQLGMMMVPS